MEANNFQQGNKASDFHFLDGNTSYKNLSHSHGDNNFMNHSRNIFPGDSKNQISNSNTRKDNGRWECNVCHKIFKQRKGFYQHINSNTHQPIKHSCSLCGKGFASLGALALHNEQASHAYLNIRTENESSESSTTLTSNRIDRPILSSSDYVNNASLPNERLAPKSFTSPNSNIGQFSLHRERVTPVSTQINNSKYELYVGSLIDYSSDVGSHCWNVIDALSENMLSENVIPFPECKFTPEQLDYKALVNGLKELISQGITSIKVFMLSNIVISHMFNDQYQLPPFYDLINTQKLEHLKSEVLQLCGHFQQITFENIPLTNEQYMLIILRKSVADFKYRQRDTQNITSNNFHNVNRSAANQLSMKHFDMPMTIPKQKASSGSHQPSLGIWNVFQPPPLQSMSELNYVDTSYLDDLVRDKESEASSGSHLKVSNDALSMQSIIEIQSQFNDLSMYQK